MPSAGQINFFNEGISFRLLQKRALRHWILEVLNRSDKSCQGINFIFCSDRYLLEMNKSYLQHDYLTDILTFPVALPASEIAADIFISIDRVRDNANTFKVPFTEELHRVMIHGILHLLGYRDKSKAEEKRMRSLEDKMLLLRKF